MIANRSIPACTVIPLIAYPDIGAAIEWLSGAFGFTLRLRIADHRAQMNAGDGGAVILTEYIADRSAAEPPPRQAVMVRVADVDGHWEHASRYGAKVLSLPVTYPYGERQYKVEDHAGHRWTFSQSLADVDPREWGGITGLL